MPAATVCPRTYSELSPEGAVEVRYISKAAVKGYVNYSRSLDRQPSSGLSQTRSQNILMRRQTCQALKSAQEMIWAQPGFFSQTSQS
jgi:hypothetical protein